MDLQRRLFDPQGLPAGCLLRTDSGDCFHVVSRLWWRQREHFLDREDAAFVVYRNGDERAKLLLRVFGYSASEGVTGGSFVASDWKAYPEREGASARRHSERSRAAQVWVPLSPVRHEVMLACVQSGRLNPIGQGKQKQSIATQHKWPDGLAYAALKWCEGATLAMLIRAADARAKSPLGPGVALAVGIPIADALAWLHSAVFSGSNGNAGVWHGRLDEWHVFLSAEGKCRLLTPVCRIDHEYWNDSLAPDVVSEPSPLAWNYAFDHTESHVYPSWAHGPARDLYQLGVLLRKILCGDEVTSQREPTSVARHQRESVLFGPDVPLELANCVRRLLGEPDPLTGAAILSASELASELRRIRSHYQEPHDESALAAAVSVLGCTNGRPLAPTFAVAGDGQDGTREPVRIEWSAYD